MADRNTSPYDNLLRGMQTGTNGVRGLPPTATDQPLGTWRDCPKCNGPIQLRETIASFQGKHLRYWSDCACVGVATDEYERRKAESETYQAQARGGAVSDTRAVKHMTFATFDATRYPPLNNPATEARAWLDSALSQPVANYTQGAVCCLYLHSAGKGRGKTHLAAAIAAEAQTAGRVVYFADEISYIERYWAADLEAKAGLSQLAGTGAWLTVIDDLGQRERATDSLRDAWYAVFNPRWLKRGWTVITSNYTPPELLSRGTINEATYSRIAQMTSSVIISFESSDYRMEAAQ